jgi:hypothetical protein
VNTDKLILSAASIVVRRGGVVAAEVDGEIVALNPDMRTCYGLNKVGSRVWKLIAEPRRVGDICTSLVREYDVDQATCERQVLKLLQELHGEELIEAVAATSPSRT